MPAEQRTCDMSEECDTICQIPHCCDRPAILLFKGAEIYLCEECAHKHLGPLAFIRLMKLGHLVYLEKTNGQV